MHITDTPGFQPLPSPLIESHLEMIEATIKPLVKDLSVLPSFISAALFVKDQLYRHEASTVSIVSAPHIHNEDSTFMNTSLRKRRVDLSSTTLGRTFVSHESQLEISKMNPAHLTWGAYAEPSGPHGAVLQLAFDRAAAQYLHEATIVSIVKPHLARIWAVSGLLMSEGLKRESLADELLMNVPATPNVYAIKWDIIGSTQMATDHYASFRHYLRQFTRAIVSLAGQYNAEVTSHQGDSQDIVMTIPAHIDRSDLRQIGEFGREVVLPFVQHITTLHEHLAQRYPTLSPKIRIGVAVGYVEQLQVNQTTGPVFWEIASLFKKQDPNTLILNQAAKFILSI